VTMKIGTPDGPFGTFSAGELSPAEAGAEAASDVGGRCRRARSRLSVAGSVRLAFNNHTRPAATARSPKALFAAWSLFFLFAVALASGNVLAATPLIHDGVVSGSIDVAEEVDEFTFEASAGDEVLTRAAKTGGDTYFTPYIWLYNPDGTLETTASGYVAALDCSPRSSTCQLNQSGTYHLLVMDGCTYDYRDTGTYDIHHVHPPESKQNGSLVHGGVVSGESPAPATSTASSLRRAWRTRC